MDRSLCLALFGVRVMSGVVSDISWSLVPPSVVVGFVVFFDVIGVYLMRYCDRVCFLFLFRVRVRVWIALVVLCVLFVSIMWRPENGFLPNGISPYRFHELCPELCPCFVFHFQVLVLDLY